MKIANRRGGKGVIRGLVLVAGFFVATAAQAQLQFRDCSRSTEPEWCSQSQGQLREQYPRAKRDYQAMRNIAYCLWTTCDGAVAEDRKQSCQIRRAIMKQHQAKVDRSDESHFAICVQAGL